MNMVGAVGTVTVPIWLRLEFILFMAYNSLVSMEKYVKRRKIALK